MTTRVHFAGQGAEADAAWEWLSSLDGAESDRAAGAVPMPGSACVCWWHTDGVLPAGPLTALASWLERGGRLLLTLDAVDAAHRLGLDTRPANERRAGVWRGADDELWFDKDFHPWPHRRGFAGFGPHPLFGGFEGGGPGVYTWEPAEGEPYVTKTFVDVLPAGQVVARERSYLNVNARRIVAWEYRVGAGGVLCLGAYVYFRARDRSLRPHLERLMRNALVGGSIPHAERRATTCWPSPGASARRDPSLLLPDAPALGGTIPGHDPFAESSHAVDDRPWDLAGRRILVLGGEQTGVREIWSHPHRLLTSLTVHVAGEEPVTRDTQVSADFVVRRLAARYRSLEEIAFAALEHPVAIIDYRPDRAGRIREIAPAPELELAWGIDLRRAWPYPAGAWGDLRFSCNERVLLVTDERERAIAVVLASRPVGFEVTPGTGPAVSCRLRVTLDEPLRLALVGGVGRKDLDRALRALERREIDGLTRERIGRDRERAERWASARTPDRRIDEGLEWAKRRLDGFVVDLPERGRALAAGYAASSPGWGDGRPGYAWVFGRDACWSAPALLALGEHAAVRHTLRVLLDTADITGKVAHEVTMSGLAHYDAADSTPLTLWLAARYVRWTGDIDFLAEHWTSLERAYRFSLTTDFDGDGLIENAGVGHGWIESGPLADARITLYLAAVWEAALRELGPLLHALGHERVADEMSHHAVQARRAIGKLFRTDGGYANAVDADGGRQLVQTALTAVPLVLESVDPAPAAPWLDWIASSDATTPWGVGLIGPSHPDYQPRGYHRGAVWPLFTGWVALAEYRRHRPDPALEHLLLNAALPFTHGVGLFPEALDGGDGSLAGVCPNQAWSAAMTVLPFFEGLLGLEPDAPRGAATLSPHLPPTWERLEVRNLLVGRTSFDLRALRRGDQLAMATRRTAGPPLVLTLAPALPAQNVDASVDEATVQPRLSDVAGCPHAAVTFELRGEHVVRFAF